MRSSGKDLLFLFILWRFIARSAFLNLRPQASKLVWSLEDSRELEARVTR